MSEYKDTVAALSKRFPHLFRPDGEYSTPPAWHAIVERLCEEIDAVLSDDERESMRIWQIRIKIGELRVSWIGSGVRQPVKKKIEKAIKAAVSAADTTCEVCAKPGKRRKTAGGVVLVACWKHRGG
jgi:hypothetical protein